MNKLASISTLAVFRKEFVFTKSKPEKKQQEQVPVKKPYTTQSAGQKKQTDDLIEAYNNSGKGEDFLKEYVHGLEEMMLMTHHKVRQPVANILGMANLIEQYANSPAVLKKIATYMKQSATDLDTFTRELTNFIADLEEKGKIKKK
jgi:signal transduction histidine kinase